MVAGAGDSMRALTEAVLRVRMGVGVHEIASLPGPVGGGGLGGGE